MLECLSSEAGGEAVSTRALTHSSTATELSIVSKHLKLLCFEAPEVAPASSP